MIPASLLKPLPKALPRLALLFAIARVAAGCDAPSRPAGVAASTAVTESVPAEMVRIPGGTFTMGTDSSPYPFEGPAHRVTVAPFLIDRHEVTNRQWRDFVKATGFKTDAEKWKWSGVFDQSKRKWVRVDGAQWRHPTGPKSTIEGKDDYPVVQVSWDDVQAYSRWAGKRLPTEAEWEFAARGGLEGKKYPWGDEFRPGGRIMSNHWQGSFPEKDLGTDGYIGLAPVGKFPPNGYGLVDMAGNAWEWVHDRFSAEYYAESPAANPQGPPDDPASPRGQTEYVIRGGSFLCSEGFCQGYRAAARNKNTADSATNHMGFRCARSLR